MLTQLITMWKRPKYPSKKGTNGQSGTQTPHAL